MTHRNGRYPRQAFRVPPGDPLERVLAWLAFGLLAALFGAVLVGLPVLLERLAP